MKRKWGSLPLVRDGDRLSIRVEREVGPQALARTERSIAHGLGHAGCWEATGRQQPVEQGIGIGGGAGQGVLEGQG